MFIELKSVRQHLNLDEFWHEDDDYILHLIAAAEDAVAKRLNIKSLSTIIDKHTGYLPESVRHSILLLVGTWYANRESVTSNATNVLPHSFDFLADLNKNYKSPF